MLGIKCIILQPLSYFEVILFAFCSVVVLSVVKVMGTWGEEGTTAPLVDYKLFAC